MKAMLMRHTKNSMNYLLFFFMIGAFIACYYNTFSWLQYKYSYQDSYYSHGYLIPFISLYLLYMLKDKLKTERIKGSNLGLIVIVFALMLHVVAVMSDINFVSGFSVLFYIFGCTLYLFGYRIIKITAFPIFFLVFMFPIPNAIINIVGLPTKKIAAEFGLMLIRLIGIPHYVEGFKIQLSNTVMYVGTPCNGMKSLISFAALSLLVCYILKLNLKKCILVLIGIYPLAVMLNGLRIAILLFIANKFGIEKAAPESFYHDLSGFFVFVIGLGILFGAIGVMERIKAKP